MSDAVTPLSAERLTELRLYMRGLKAKKPTRLECELYATIAARDADIAELREQILSKVGTEKLDRYVSARAQEKQDAVAAEREACAKVAESRRLHDLAKAIRARGKEQGK